MITRGFVEPAYKCIRLMDITDCIPLYLDLQTGRFHQKSHPASAIIHWIIYITGALKVLHYLYAVVKLTVDFKQQTFPLLSLTIVLLCLGATSTYWGWELFHKGIIETIILFNSLSYAPSSPGRDQQFKAKVVQKRWKWAKIICAKLTSVRLRFRLLLSTLMSLSIQELLAVLAPFAVNLFLPMHLLMVVIFPHWHIFTTSFVCSKEGAAWTWGMGCCCVFEAVAMFYVESNILYFFFFNLAFQVTHLVRIKKTTARMRYKKGRLATKKLN